MSGSWDGFQTEQSITLSAGGTGAMGTGAHTIAVLFNASNAAAAFLSLLDSTPAVVREFLTDSGSLFALNDFTGMAGVSTSTWYVAAVSKAAGSSAYRYHLWAYDSGGAGSMTHANGGSQGDGNAVNAIRVGFGGGGDKMRGLIAVVGLWTSALSDANLNTLVSTHLSAWAALTPQALISLQNWNGSTGCVDVVGTSSQTGLVGTVATGANPPSFDFSLTTAAAPPAPRTGDAYRRIVGRLGRFPNQKPGAVTAAAATATVTMAGAGTLTASVVDTVPATVTMAGSGALTAAGTDTVPATVTMAGSGTLTAAAVDTIPATVTLAGTGSLTATPLVTHPATVTLAGAGAVTVSGTDTIPAVVTLTGTGALSAAIGGSVTATITLTGSGTLATTAAVTHPVAVTMTGAGTLTAAVAVTHPAAPALTGAGVLTVAGLDVIAGLALMQGAGTLAVILGNPNLPITVTGTDRPATTVTGTDGPAAVVTAASSPTVTVMST